MNNYDYKNIFLHFLNFDTLEIYNIKNRYFGQDIEQQIIFSLYIGVLLSDKYLFLPLGFPYETELTYNILCKLVCFRDEGLIRYSLKEQDLPTFLFKKKEGYDPYRNIPIYTNFYKHGSENLYKNISAPWVKRDTSIGNYCVNRWHTSSIQELSNDWKNIYDCLPDKLARKQLEKTLKHFNEKYLSSPFIWPSVSQELSDFPKIIKNKMRVIFEGYYYEAYLKEYKASILFDLPFEIGDFNIFVKYSPLCSYRLYFNYLLALELRNFIYSAREYPQQIIDLKYNPNMIQLKNLYKKCSNESFPTSLEISLSSYLNIEPWIHYKKQLLSDLPRIARNLSKKIIIPKIGIKIDALEMDDQNIMTTILIATATDLESKNLFSIAQKRGIDPTNKYFKSFSAVNLGAIKDCVIYFVQSQMGSGGPGGSALTITDAIEQLKPDFVVSLGIAFGSNPKKQNIGDVLVSSDVRCYEPERIGSDKIIHRGDRMPSSPILVNRCNTAKLTWKKSDIHTGLLLSGEKLVDNQKFKQKLLSLEPEAIGGEMEGAGICAACYRKNIPWLIIKGICDWAENKNSKNQDLASENAINFFWHILDEGAWSNIH